MPLTFRRSSGLANGSLARYSTMACAFDAPMPGRRASSAALAVFTLIRPPPPSLARGEETGPRVSPQRSPTATIFVHALIRHLLRGASAGAGSWRGQAQASCHRKRGDRTRVGRSAATWLRNAAFGRRRQPSLSETPVLIAGR